MDNTKKVDPLVKDNKFIGTYWQWLKRELSGWDRVPWLIFGLGIGLQLGILIFNPIRQLSKIFSHGNRQSF